MRTWARAEARARDGAGVVVAERRVEGLEDILQAVAEVDDELVGYKICYAADVLEAACRAATEY